MAPSGYTLGLQPVGKLVATSGNPIFSSSSKCMRGVGEGSILGLVTTLTFLRPFLAR